MAAQPLFPSCVLLFPLPQANGHAGAHLGGCTGCTGTPQITAAPWNGVLLQWSGHPLWRGLASPLRTCLSRLMRLLATLGIFREEKETTTPGGEGKGSSYSYHLTAVSRLLVVDDDGGHPCLSAFMAILAAPFHVVASLRLAEWLENDDGGAAAETSFMMAHGTGFWGVVGRDAELAADFYAGMRDDSRFVAQIIVSECREVFAGVNSLVDVGGGDGTMAKAIAKAFPHVQCSVLELPQVVRGMQGEGEGQVEFIAGDMMVFIPPADAVILKMHIPHSK